MSLILEGLQFCKELSTTEGDMTPGSPVPSLTLLGPPDGFESIVTKIGNGNEGLFFLRHGFAWMRFRGTVTNPDQLSVDEVLNSSDAGNPLVLGPGTKQVYCALDEYSIKAMMRTLVRYDFHFVGPNTYNTVDQADTGGAYQSLGAALSSSYILLFELGDVGKIFKARWVVIWASDNSDNKTRLIHADDGPTNITEIAEVQSNGSGNPIVSAVDVTAEFQALQASVSTYKNIGLQTSKENGSSLRYYAVRLELTYEIGEL